MVKKPFNLLLLVLFILPFPAFSQWDNYMDNLRDHVLGDLGEKVYVSTDKDIYGLNDRIYFQVYLVDNHTNEFSAQSKVVYLDLLNADSLLLSRTHVYTPWGSGHGSVKLPENSQPGRYVLRAFTSLITETAPELVFQKSLRIISAAETVSSPGMAPGSDPLIRGGKPDIKFLPEGGNLVAGGFSTVAVKGIDREGYGFPFEGDIYEGNNRIGGFKCNEWGMGKIILKFEAGKEYYALVDIHGESHRYELPEVQESGYTLSAAFVNNNLTVLAKYEGSSTRNFMLVLSMRGITYGVARSVNGSVLIRSSGDEFPEGILTIDLVDEEGFIRASRLLYVMHDAAVKATSVKLERNSFSTRDSVDLLLGLDGSGLIDSALISLSVAREDLFLEGGSNIRSFLLLQSDLRGNIESPGSYFDPENEDRGEDLDLLLLTQGWRRYTPENLALAPRESKVIYPEKGLSLRGKVSDYYNAGKGIKSKVWLTFLENPMYFVEFETPENGLFTVHDLQFPDTLTAIVQMRKVRKKERDFDKRDPLMTDLLDREFRLPPLPVEKTDTDMGEFQKLLKQMEEIDLAYFQGQKVRIMDEVVIEEKKPDITEGRFISYLNPTRRVILDSMNVTIGLKVVDIIRMLPGVQVRGSFPNYTYMIRGISSITGSNNALILLDGMPIDGEFINMMNASEISFIDMLSGPNAAAFGSRGGNGVIALYSKTGEITGGFANMSRDWGINSFKIVGFQTPEEFYSPDYSVTKPEHRIPDFRTTLHWQAGIFLRAGETTHIRFYTSDEKTDYRLFIEGLTWDGRVLVESTEINVR